jgi:hypothetical protein
VVHVFRRGEGLVQNGALFPPRRAGAFVRPEPA